MKESLYFDGRQIKNYLIGFASLFSEIPYKNRYGKLVDVPIHYGSPSDVISFLESNVDNAETKNRNRLKDISIPMFSFRMTGIEKNNEKRRAPHDTITVDLRPLGYNTGYVTMRPAPYRFTMELVCWASSDYQAFEITEQIIPYFNSPQQVRIEPLPRCPVSTTEIFLDNIEIDTDPESQKTSSLVTMTFSLTGWLLTQPKIWSTNMAFEFNMLSGDLKNGYENTKDSDFSVGHEIVEYSTINKKLKSEDKFSNLENFILNSPLILKEYGETLDLYKILITNKKIDNHNTIIDNTPLTATYKDKEIVINEVYMTQIIETMEDLGYVFANEQIQNFMKDHSLEGNLKVIDRMFEDSTDTLDVFIKLLDNNLATKGFNSIGIEISNSEKMAIYGTPRIDIEDNLTRLRNYSAALDNLKINKETLEYSEIYNKRYSVYAFDVNIPYMDLPDEIKGLIPNNYLKLNKTLPQIKKQFEINTKNNEVEITLIGNPSEITVIDEINDKIEIKTMNLVNNKISFSLDDIQIHKSYGIIINSSDYAFEVQGFIVIDLQNPIPFNELDFRIFKMQDNFNIGHYKGKEVDVYFDEEFYKIFNIDTILNEKFKNLELYIISSLIYTQMQEKNKINLENISIIEKKYKITLDDIIKNANQLKHLIEISKNYIDIVNETNNNISGQDLINKQQKATEDVSQAIAFDDNNKPIYDVNKDGFIDNHDLTQLGSVVDNPNEFDYELKYGIWYKRFRIENMSEARITKVIYDIKVLYYLLEKEDVSEIYDYLYLNSKDLVDKTYDINPNNIEKQKEIKALGYDLEILETKLLFMRMFLDSLKNLLVNERDYLIYKLTDIREESKAMLYRREGLDLDKIIIGKSLEKFLNSNINFDEKMEKETFIRSVLPFSLGEYYNYIYEFNLLINDMHKSGLFKESLAAESVWLDVQLPNVKERIENRYK